MKKFVDGLWAFIVKVAPQQAAVVHCRALGRTGTKAPIGLLVWSLTMLKAHREARITSAEGDENPGKGTEMYARKLSVYYNKAWSWFTEPGSSLAASLAAEPPKASAADVADASASNAAAVGGAGAAPAPSKHDGLD